MAKNNLRMTLASLLVICTSIGVCFVKTAHLTDSPLRRPVERLIQSSLGPRHAHVALMGAGSDLQAVATVDANAEQTAQFSAALATLLQLDGRHLTVIQGPVPETPDGADLLTALVLFFFMTLYLLRCQTTWTDLARRTRPLAGPLAAAALGALALRLPPAVPALLALLAGLTRMAKRAPGEAPRPIGRGAYEAVVFLLSLPAEQSALVFRELGPTDVQTLTAEITKLPAISEQTRKEVVRTFQIHLKKVCQKSCCSRLSRSGVRDPKSVATLVKLYLQAVVSPEVKPVARPTTVWLRPRLAFAYLMLAGATIGTLLGFLNRCDLVQYDLQCFVGGNVLSVATVNDATVVTAVGMTPEQIQTLRPLVQERLRLLGLDPNKLALLSVPSRPLPRLPVATLLAIAAGMLSWIHLNVKRKSVPVAVAAKAPVVKAAALKAAEVDALSIEVGRGLLSLVDPNQGKPLLERVPTLRVGMSMELGLRIPGIRFRDNLRLKPTEFRVMVRGHEAFRGNSEVGCFLAIAPNAKLEQLFGEPTIDPTYGMPGKWIKPIERERAENLGAMIFDACGVVVTAVAEVVRNHAAELLTFQESQAILAEKENQPLVDALELDRIQIWQVLQNLLREQVSILDRVAILQSLLVHSRETTDVDALSEHARSAVLGSIFEQLSEQPQATIPAWFLPPRLDALLRHGSGAELASEIFAHAAMVAATGRMLVIVTHPDLRLKLRNVLTRDCAAAHATRLKAIVVLSTRECAFRGQRVVASQD